MDLKNLEGLLFMLTNVQTSEQDSHALITVQVAVHTHVSHTVTHVHVVSVRYTTQRTLEQVHVSVKAKERV